MTEIYIYCMQKIRIIVFSSFWLSLINNNRGSEVWWFYGSACLFSVFFNSFRLVWKYLIKENFLICFKKLYNKFLYYLHLIIPSFFIDRTFSFMHLVLICFMLEVDFCLSKVIQSSFLNFRFCFKKSRGNICKIEFNLAMKLPNEW